MGKLFPVTLLLFITFPFALKAQEIGELVPEKPPMVFPDNAYGVDIMFSDGGPGLGFFFRHKLGGMFTGFTDISFSESKDEREFQYVDIFGNTYTLGKLNRIFLIPLNFGVQYRVFENDLYDNLRPYINAGIGPSLILTTPSDKEFFKAFGSAKAKVTLGGYFGIGANFGLDKNSLVGLNIRYYIIHLFNRRVESIQGKPHQNLGGIFLTFNLGFMY